MLFIFAVQSGLKLGFVCKGSSDSMRLARGTECASEAWVSILYVPWRFIRQGVPNWALEGIEDARIGNMRSGVDHS